jgi:hypothetical protein
MNLTAQCPDCDTRFTVEDALAKIVADARAKVAALEADEADAAKELDRVRAEVTNARGSLAALLSLTTATDASR